MKNYSQIEIFNVYKSLEILILRLKYIIFNVSRLNIKCTL